MTKTALVEKTLIPDIDDDRLEKLAKRIKPVINFKDSGLSYIESVNLRNHSFLWDPKPTQKAKGLHPLVKIQTCHTYAAPALYKPSVAEVLSQIPKVCLEQVVAFQIIGILPEERNGYHVAVVQLYSKK